MSDSPRPTPAPRKPALPKKASKEGRKSSAAEFEITHLSPTSAVYNKREKVIVVFKQTLPSNVEFTVCFTGLQTEKQSRVTANRIADNVLVFTSPEYFPPEETKLTVHHGNHATKLCTYIQPFAFKSPLQDIKESLLMVSDPVEFMCAALHLRRKNSIALDFELEKQFRKHVPPNFDLLVGDTRARVEIVESACSNPTLLHFAARYNLLRLAVALLECPGGQNALNMADCDNLTPSEIAYQCGHDNLAAVLSEAQQNPNKLEDIYESMHDPIYTDYLTLYNNAGEDDVYVAMNCAEEDEIYAKMTGFNLYQDDDNIYQNSAEVAEEKAALDDFGYESRTAIFGDRISGKDKTRNDRPWDSRSIHSISSTSSAESSASGGSCSDYATRPRLPEPRPPELRQRASLPEPQFKERTNSLPPKSRSVSDYTKTGSLGNFTKRGGYQDVAFNQQRYQQDDAPPLPPPKNPNIN